jgi:protein SCO1/2
MKPFITQRLKRTLCTALLAGGIVLALPAAARAPAAAPAPLPGDSVYRIDAALTDQQGHPFTLAQRRGHPVLVSMFYNSCQFVCPMLIDTVRMTEQSLPPAQRAALATLLITFDPERDDVNTLKAVAQQRALDPASWTLARTDAASVRKIAAALDIQYRLLSNGEYNHTTVLVLLDRNGSVVGRSKKMGAVDPAFLKLIRSTLAADQRAG